MTGKVLTSSKELLFRQVRAEDFLEARKRKTTFRPTRSSKGLLSVDRGALTNAERAYLDFKAAGHDSIGSFAVTVGEASKFGLKCREDPIEGDRPNPAHAVIDFSAHLMEDGKLDDKGVEKAVRLAALAFERGCLFPASIPNGTAES
jgi:hypothetical protein